MDVETQIYGWLSTIGILFALFLIALAVLMPYYVWRLARAAEQIQRDVASMRRDLEQCRDDLARLSDEAVSSLRRL